MSASIPPCCSGAIRAGGIVAFAAFSLITALARAQSIPEVTSTLDAKTHRVTPTVFNTSQKSIVAAALTFHQYDANDADIGDATASSDGVYAFAYPDQPAQAAAIEQQEWIKPNASAVPFVFVTDPRAVNVDVEVAAVIYDDRSAVGAEAAINALFASRADAARELAEAAKILSPYPSSPEAAMTARSSLQRLLGAGRVNMLLPSSAFKNGMPDGAAWKAAQKLILEQAAALSLQSRRAQ